MKQVTLIGITLAVLCAWQSGRVPDAAADVLLNEIMADPARDWDGDTVYNFRDDEWVEIVNTGVAPVVLDGYRLASADSVWRYEFTGSLDPGSHAVVFGSESYAWEQSTGNPAFGFRLANSGGTLVLWKLTATDSVIVDSYTYQDHEAEDDRSTGRHPDGAGEWKLMDAINPYSGGAMPSGSGCAPSPGAIISCPVPAKSETWGRIKALYVGN